MAGTRKVHVLSAATGKGVSSTFLFIFAVWGKETGLGLLLDQSLLPSRGLAHNRSLKMLME